MKKFNYQSYGSHVGRMNYGGAKFCRFALFPLMLLMLLLLPTRMVAQTDPAYAEYDNATRTLTFKCGPSKPEEAYELNVGNNIPGWLAKRSKIEKVVFDASFANARPTSCYGWFADCQCLTKIEGIENLNTESVEDMSYMFGNCNSLSSLDLSKLNTAKVENMAYMFYYCRSLSSLNLSNINTAKVKNMAHMFYYCQSLSSLNLSNINTANVTDMEQMFYSCSKLSSLDLTNFNTAKVKNMRSMFWNCSALTTIYVSDKFVTGQVTRSSDMFLYCSNLKGYSDSKIDHNYANCGTDGYFTPGCAYAEYDKATETLTFKCGLSKPKGAYDLNVGNNTPEWWTNRFNYEDHEEHNKIRKVVFDASFANARPTSCYMWFDRCSDLTEIEGIANLNTEEVTNMGSMFAGCYYLTPLDVSNFNTQKVENMHGMFSNFNRLTSLDLSNFDTKEVTDMSSMFWNSSALTTIYVSDKFVTTKVSSGADMFKGCASLKGAIPEYSKSKTNHTYANYVDGYFTKLVVRNGDKRYGITGETTQLTVDNLVLADGKDFVAYEPFTATAASYNRTMKEGTTWATLCLPFEVSLANQNFRAFKLLSADDVTETVELEEIKTSIEAGTPVIIKMKDGATKLDFTVANKEIAKDVQTAGTANSNYQLQGLYTQKMFSKDADNNCYIVKGDKLMNPAKLLDKTTTEHVGSKPFRAFMVDKSPAPSAGARMFSISVGGSTTAIEQLETTADSKAEYYDLQGRRLQDLQKGINIVKRGGKTMKVIIK